MVTQLVGVADLFTLAISRDRYFICIQFLFGKGDQLDSRTCFNGMLACSGWNNIWPPIRIGSMRPL